MKKVVVDKDEGPRAGTTRESLAKLKPVSRLSELGRRWISIQRQKRDI